MKFPFGERESEVGVSLCPSREGRGDAGERMSRTYTTTR